MNTQELKEAIEKLPQVVVKTPTDVVSVEHVSVWSVLDLVDQLDGLQTAVIPQSVVEREKVYTVKIPNPHHDGITVLEKVGDDVIMSQMDDYLTDWQKEPEYQLTAAEIRKNFDWAWQWAEEVKEVGI